MLKRPIAGIYTTSNLMSFECYVDSTMRFFFKQLDTRFETTKSVCDFGNWLQYFAFDVIGELTFSKRLGFLECGEDVEGITDAIWSYFKKTSPVRPCPQLLAHVSNLTVI
jgi:Cytochrome P450